MRSNSLQHFMCAALVSLTAGLASSEAGDKETFLNQPRMYLSYEITQVETVPFSAPANALNDGSHSFNRLFKGVIPFDMPMPGSPPMSSMPVDPAEMMEENRFAGWMVSVPESEEAEQQFATGKLDPSKNPMFMPMEFMVDDRELSRFRDEPTNAFATSTRTVKGKGTAYMARSGMLMCDLKKMTCDLNNIFVGINSLDDKVTSTTTTSVTGSGTTQEQFGAELRFPQFTEALARQLAGFKITFPEPINLSFSDPAAPSVKLKMTISSILPSRSNAAR